MFKIKPFIVRKNEKGILLKDNDFVQFLEAGQYRFSNFFHTYEVAIFDLSNPRFLFRLTDYLVKKHPEEIEKHCVKVETDKKHVALVSFDQHLSEILLPAQRALFWNDIIDIDVELIDITENLVVPSDLLRLLIHERTGITSSKFKKIIYSQQVPEYHIGLLMIEGKYVKTLSPGIYGYWQINQSVNIELWDTRLQTLEVSGQEILTKDKVSLRINLAASYQIDEVLKTLSQVKKPEDFLYRELQFGLRVAVGTQKLDELLEDKQLLDNKVLAYIQEKALPLGITITTVGIKDIILPGDMKTILNQVVEAEKSAQANSIRRREETGATRSLLNTAKVMENNPTALRLKELETLEKITDKIGSLSVYGGLDGVLNELVKIKR